MRLKRLGAERNLEINVMREIAQKTGMHRSSAHTGPLPRRDRSLKIR